MSATATPIRECDHALDYLYSMLEGEAKTRFEAHLATCPRCQAELDAFGKVRVAAQASLRTVEPSERLTGALHAQLMHTAAQRKPRGKVLPFLRRVISHPSYAAAAALVLVGGAVGLQFTRGKLLMPPAVQSDQAPAPAASSTPPAELTVEPTPATGTAAKDSPTAAAPAASPVVLAPGATADEKAANKIVVTAEPKSDPQLDGLLKQKAGNLEPAKTRKATDKSTAFKDGESGLVDDLTERRAITARLKKDSSAPAAGGDLDRAFGDSGGASSGKGYAAPSGTKAPAPGPSVQSGRGAESHSTAAPRTEAVKEAPALPPPPPRQSAAPAAPSTPAPKPVATPQKRAADSFEGNSAYDAKPRAREEEQARRDDGSRANHGTATGGSVAMQPRSQADEPAPPARAPANHAAKPRPSEDALNAAPAAESPALSSSANNKNDDEARREPAAKAEQARDDIDTERSRAAQLAQAGKCSEAAAIYNKLDKKVPERLSAQDRVAYERCLTALGRYDTAQEQLNQMRAGKAQGGLPAAAINAEQKNIDVQRKRSAERNLEPPMPSERRASSPKKAKTKASSNAADAEQAAPADPSVKKAYSY